MFFNLSYDFSNLKAYFMANIINFVRKNVQEDLLHERTASSMLAFIEKFDPKRFDLEFDQYKKILDTHTHDYDNPHQDGDVYLSRDELVQTLYTLYCDKCNEIAPNESLPSKDLFEKVVKNNVNFLAILRNIYVGSKLNRKESDSSSRSYYLDDPKRNSERYRVIHDLPSQSNNSFIKTSTYLPPLANRLSSDFNAHPFYTIPRFDNVKNWYNYDPKVRITKNYSHYLCIPSYITDIDIPNPQYNMVVNLNENNPSQDDTSIIITLSNSNYINWSSTNTRNDKADRVINSLSKTGEGAVYPYYPITGISFEIGIRNRSYYFRISFFDNDGNEYIALRKGNSYWDTFINGYDFDQDNDGVITFSKKIDGFTFSWSPQSYTDAKLRFLCDGHVLGILIVNPITLIVNTLSVDTVTSQKPIVPVNQPFTGFSIRNIIFQNETPTDANVIAMLLESI